MLLMEDLAFPVTDLYAQKLSVYFENLPFHNVQYIYCNTYLLAEKEDKPNMLQNEDAETEHGVTYYETRGVLLSLALKSTLRPPNQAFIFDRKK